MRFFVNAIPLFGLLLAALLAFSARPATAAAAGHYQLTLRFDLDNGRLHGTALLDIAAGEPLSLAFPELTITDSQLTNQDGARLPLPTPQGGLDLPAAIGSRSLLLSFIAEAGGENQIDPGGIVLTDNWHPVPLQPRLFTLTAAIPAHFTAVSESDQFPLPRQGERVMADFSQPTSRIHFVAGPYRSGEQVVREGLAVHSLFFPAEEHLAEGYRQAAAEHIRRYEALLGPFPYSHYVITANRQPTGYGMPTFTLLGQAVLRLPFIRATSLGHEIVHSWFGNAVAVDSSRGNWAEGLTTFLSDHTFREEEGDAVEVRREAISRYLSWVHPDSVIPLQQFISASHSQPMAEGRRAVGYQRGAMLFAELRQQIGKTAFTAGLRRLAADYRGRQASWDDLERSFSTAAGRDLAPFFRARLERSEIPKLSAEDIRVEYQDARPLLSFSLLQHSMEPFDLVLPVQIDTAAGSSMVTVTTAAARTRVRIPLADVPLGFRLDPEFSLLRQLAADEFLPAWSRLLGAKSPLILLGREEEQKVYQPLIDLLADNTPRLETGLEATGPELAEQDLLILGGDQPVSRALFALPDHPADGLTIEVRRHPLNPDRVAVLVTSPNQEQTVAAARLLRHYGRYTYLEFHDGRNRAKEMAAGPAGLFYPISELPPGGATSALGDFASVVAALRPARVVYVGETHTSLSDHRLQLRLIESLHASHPDLAIGMEMFPASAQPVLDRYTLGDGSLNEADFLKESGYFDVWRFDYRLYRDILNYARRHRLPVLALNLDRQIVSAVSRGGGTVSLDPEQRRTLPIDRDLSLPGYGERLARVQRQHLQGGHGSSGLAGFIQAQALWDETMAATIVDYLRRHPQHRLVVLAGTEHTRKDSAIPPRVARRMAIPQASVVNIAAGTAPADLAGQADFFFFAEPAELGEPAKIGVVLDPQSGKDGQALLTINELSPHGKAAAAGLLAGDRIVSIEGRPVADFADLQIALLDRRVGDTVTLTVLRGAGGEEQRLTLRVELSRLPPSRPPL